MKHLFITLIGLALLASAVIIVAEDLSGMAKEENKPEGAIESPSTGSADQIVVYYLHMNRRCATCQKLEAYSKEAVESGFGEQLKDSSLQFKILNFEQEGNEHFAKDYQLYSQSLVLSRQQNGRESEWKNLDKIWELVGSKDEFIKYVQNEVDGFMKPTKEK